jgi:hypothetical protein
METHIITSYFVHRCDRLMNSSTLSYCYCSGPPGLWFKLFSLIQLIGAHFLVLRTLLLPASSAIDSFSGRIPRKIAANGNGFCATPNSGDETESRVMLSAKLDEATLTGDN